MPASGCLDRGYDDGAETMKLRGWEIFCIFLAFLWFLPVAWITLLTVAMRAPYDSAIETVGGILLGLGIWLVPIGVVYSLGLVVRSIRGFKKSR